MKLAVLLLLSSLAFAQQSATTSAPCSPIAPDNIGTITIKCTGVSKEEWQKVIAILNKIVANKIDTETVMAKLDEILHAVNPNLPTKSYFCDGNWKVVGVGPNAALDVNVSDHPDPSVEEMRNLFNTHNQYEELLKVCTTQIESKPEWLTPRLYCAIAYGALGNAVKAKEMLDVYDARKGPAYDGDASCKKLSDFLHTNLK